MNLINVVGGPSLKDDFVSIDKRLRPASQAIDLFEAR